jgi:hypothetical protein
MYYFILLYCFNFLIKTLEFRNEDFNRYLLKNFTIFLEILSPKSIYCQL